MENERALKKHGGAGRGQGRKPTGRKRTFGIGAKFTEGEIEEIKTTATEHKKTLSDILLTGIRKLKKGK